MYMLNGWWFLSSGGSYPPVFMVVVFSAEASYVMLKNTLLSGFCMKND